MAVDAIASQFAKILTSMAKEEVTMLLGAEDALRELEKDVLAHSDVIREAGFPRPAVRRWLADVKDLVYDAGDIIDYSKTQAEKLDRLSSESPVFCCTPILLFFLKIALHHRMGNSIRSVYVRLEGIRQRKPDLNLIAAVAAAPRVVHHGSSSSSGNQRWTSSVLVESDIVGSGIEDDTSYLVGLLTGKELGSQRIPIVAIWGMGGVGKTTLAQKICNHPSIKDAFNNPPPMWVCVSQQYTNENILRVIIRRCASASAGAGAGGGDPSAGGGDPKIDHESFAELHERLAKLIAGKKLFLILDDVWAADVWVDLLRSPLQSGAAAGSRVLITTREEGVAIQMGATHRRRVRQLNNEESWSMLCNEVFHEDGRVGEGGEVKEIGWQIAIKCCGLPLAIKTVAGVLKKKSSTRREWEKVLTNPAWSLEDLPDGVMGVLYLSYQDLPLELRQCFIFCSLFPEDYVFEREQLTLLWVAEGFIAEKGGDVLLEDIADNYYNELLSRSLLQPYLYSGKRCKMHDLLRSLAQFLAGDEYFVGDVKQLVNASSSSSSTSLMKLRHLWIVDTTDDDDDDVVTLTQVVKKHESLWTLFLNGRNLLDDTMDFLFSKLGCLRVLNLSGVKSLPKSVGNLIHLRYLNLSGSEFLEQLPETVRNLSNLQYLILDNCKKLKKLPRGIAKLYKLRFLHLQVDGLPAGIENLQRTLKGQPRVRDSLLKHLRHLSHLKLTCDNYSKRDWDDNEKQKMQLIFEVDLFPPPSLETFIIIGYSGLKLPSWPLLQNLQRLELFYCKYLKQLPALGQLPNLNYLSISGADSVESIGPEFMGMEMGVGASAFPMLTTLVLERLSNLVEWQWEAEDGVVAVMPRLEELIIWHCKKLRCLPGGLGSVTTLTTYYALSLSVIENLHSLKVLDVSHCDNLTRVSNLPALQDMKVIYCRALREVEGLYSLQSLYIHDPKMESLPGWLLLKQGQPAFPMLKALTIKVYLELVLRRCLVDGPDWPKIQHYPQVEITAGKLFVRYTRDPFTFTTNLEAADGSAGDGSRPVPCT